MTGLVIRDTSGNIILDMTSNISQSAGSVITNGVNGSITISAPPVGRKPFFIVTPLNSTSDLKGNKPGVVMTETSLSWAYSFNTGGGWGFYAANCRINYGYY